MKQPHQYLTFPNRLIAISSYAMLSLKLKWLLRKLVHDFSEVRLGYPTRRAPLTTMEHTSLIPALELRLLGVPCFAGPSIFVTLWSRDSMKITVKACQLVQTQSAL